ncbi:9412_t:CDS:2 [Dentiscutata erythropus]|uniref:9412_t:CDS:1 n=1 Tax=Dentiscutata erythropus TaxID=1348616 RepID=A0A9N9CER5_9GLOM|nr:9412_t:CDS:2 [Dentiscutata erythropus]
MVNPAQENVENRNIIQPDVRFLEFTEEETCDGKDYLEVELLESVNSHVDDNKHIRNLGKRKTNETTYQIPAKRSRQLRSSEKDNDSPKLDSGVKQIRSVNVSSNEMKSFEENIEQRLKHGNKSKNWESKFPF